MQLNSRTESKQVFKCKFPQLRIMNLLKKEKNSQIVAAVILGPTSLIAKATRFSIAISRFYLLKAL